MSRSYKSLYTSLKTTPQAKPTVDAVTAINQHSASTVIDTEIEKRAALANNIDPNDTPEECDTIRPGV